MSKRLLYSSLAVIASLVVASPLLSLVTREANAAIARDTAGQEETAGHRI